MGVKWASSSENEAEEKGVWKIFMVVKVHGVSLEPTVDLNERVTMFEAPRSKEAGKGGAIAKK